MKPDPASTPRNRSLQGSRLALARVAPIVRYGLVVVGVLSVLNQLSPMVSDSQFTWGERRVMGIITLITLGGFGLAGWAAGWLLRAASELIAAVVETAETATRSSYLIEAQLIPTLTRVALALEGHAVEPSRAAETRAMEAIRTSIREGRWGRAGRLLEAFGREYPQATEVSALASDLAEARQAEADDLAERLESAMETGNGSETLSCRDALTRHIRGEALRDLDLKVARWLLGWVRGRVRTGETWPEVAELAARGADRFGDTAEGRSLLAAVPDLRRRAGLCPACARPLRGGDICPACSHDPATRPEAAGATPKGRP